MTLLTLAQRSLRFHARSHLGAVLGATVAAAVLLGALLVGDSVRLSLRHLALARLAGAHVAIASGDRFFRDDLASRLEAAPATPEPSANSLPHATVALLLEGVATSQASTHRANRVQVIGIQDSFPTQDPPSAPQPGETWINQSLARQLNVQPGDDIILRVRKPSALSRDTIITPRSDSSFALRLKVTRLAPADLDAFQLAASQLPPFNAFVALPALQKPAHLEGRANLLLARAPPQTASTHPHDRSPSATLAQFQRQLAHAWLPADAELSLHPILPAPPQLPPMLELGTRRIFLDPPVLQSLHQHTPTNAFRVLTYLVNQIRHGTNATPYSMVCATDGPHVPPDLQPNEIVVNQWLAQDLNLHVGDPVDLVYYVLDSVRSLAERTNQFTVRAIVPLAGWHADRTLMPEFPGLAKAESTHDWDAGFDLVHEIRDQDEAYWKAHRGTPKAFISLAAGQTLWTNRFGSLTALRFPASSTHDIPALQQQIESTLRARLDPSTFGLRPQPIRADALRAAASGQDFGQLFIGFSIFLVAAALLLMGLLFQFSIERRTEEVGTLLALGFPPRLVRRLLLLEGGALALVGSLLGLLGAFLYARAMIHGLTTIWRDAVGTSSLSFHATPATLALGLLAGWLVAWLAMAWALRQQARPPARQLLSATSFSEDATPAPTSSINRTPWIALLAGLLAAALLLAAPLAPPAQTAGLFFGAGALLLLAGTALASHRLLRLSHPRTHTPHPPPLTLHNLGLRNIARRRRRSLAVITLLSCGSFLVTSLGVFRLDALRNAHQRSSGTGGFALIGESTVPITLDLNTSRGRESLGLDPADLQDVHVVALRVRDGDDASCLNLNRARQPRLLGVDPHLLAQRQAFTFTHAAPGLDLQAGWNLLTPGSEDDPNVLPAIGDANSIQWALGRKVGDTLDYVDETGRPLKVRLVAAVANSILQGNLLVDESALTRRFPAVSGYRMFLLDAPSNHAATVSRQLTRALSDYGLELVPTTQRLNAFNAVQNTYLGTFQILGGLGLLLGSVGLGVLVLRHVLERRGELALLLAVGFRRNALLRLVLTEHAALLLAGLALGAVAALVAVLPATLAPGAERPAASLLLTWIAVLGNGLLWTWFATHAALRGRLLDALRNE